MTQLKIYPVWDAPTRWFHWINVICIIGLAAVGLVILNANALGVPNTGKASLKSVHTWIGYVFAINLLWRLLWAFIGNRYARWRAILPGVQGGVHTLRSYLGAMSAGKTPQYVGHNPAARLSITVLFLLMLVQAVTGLLLAGTDLFYPPLGAWIAQWIAAPGIDPATLVPYAPETYDKIAYESMRAMRKPFALVHLYSFYALCVMVVLHVTAVVIAEVKEGGGIVSAMFSGKKILSEKPVDEN